LEIQINKKPEYLRSFKLNNVNNIDVGIDHSTNIYNIDVGTTNSTNNRLDGNDLDEYTMNNEKDKNNKISFSLRLASKVNLS
jgi:hypothetical protein